MSVTIDEQIKPETIIRPGKGWAALNLREIWQFRDLLVTLAARDVTLRYRQTALGVVWVVLQPLLAACIFTFVFGRVAKLPSNGIPFFVFSYAGLLGWNAFNTTVTKASTCLLGNATMVQKIYFPRLILPLSTLFSTLIDFGVALLMMIFLLLTYHITPHAGLLLLPVWLVLMLALATGIGAIMAAWTVSYRDVQYMLPVMTQFVMYASPVAYSLTALHKVPANLRQIFYLNPLVGLLEGFRWSLLGRHYGPMHWGLAAYSAGFALIALILGAIMFKRMERKFADVI